MAEGPSPRWRAWAECAAGVLGWFGFTGATLAPHLAALWAAANHMSAFQVVCLLVGVTWLVRALIRRAVRRATQAAGLSRFVAHVSLRSGGNTAGAFTHLAQQYAAELHEILGVTVPPPAPPTL